MNQERPILYLVICAAPPARKVGQLISLLQADGWAVHAITTPEAATWIDAEDLRRRTGHPVRSQPRRPDDPDRLPHAEAVLVVPATFNTINKWTAGISDNFALGVLNEILGTGLPIVVSPYAKTSLANHPAFGRSLETLRECGVYLTDTNAIRPRHHAEGFRWSVVTKALQRARRAPVSPDP